MKITIYSQPACQPCRLTKKLLDSKGLAYTEVDVLSDDAAYAYITEELGARNVPVVVTDQGDVWKGIDQARTGILALA